MEKFVERMNEFMITNNLNASQLAEKTGTPVPRFQAYFERNICRRQMLCVHLPIFFNVPLIIYWDSLTISTKILSSRKQILLLAKDSESF